MTRKPGAMTQIVVAPCSPFSVTGELMRKSAELARHLRRPSAHPPGREPRMRKQFCQQQFGYRPRGVYAVGRLGGAGCLVSLIRCTSAKRKWTFTHATGCGVAHCPSSNMRLASGIAPLREVYAAGVKLAWAWMVPPVTIARICWVRHARPC